METLVEKELRISMEIAVSLHSGGIWHKHNLILVKTVKHPKLLEIRY